MAEQQILVYGTSWCGDCRRAVRVLNEHQAQYTYIDIEKDDAGLAYVVEINRGARSVPTILFPDGSILIEPSNAALAAKLTSLAS